MREPHLALVTLPVTPPPEVPLDQALVLRGFGIAGVLSIGMFLAGMPLVSMCIVAIAGVSNILLATTMAARRERMLRTEEIIAPEAIASNELRTTYRTILCAFGEIERAVAEAPRLRPAVDPVVERCAAAVRLCGRMALLANPLQSYLDNHDPGWTRAELERLKRSTEATTDEIAASALGHAAAARARQLATYDELAAMRDRVQARLELVGATLESFAAVLVRLHVVDEEQVLLAGESVTDHLQEVGEELEVLESALAVDLAA